MGLRISLEITQGVIKIGKSLLLLHHIGNLKMADGKKNAKQNINNILAAQEVETTGAVINANATRRTLYAGHFSVNTVLR